VWSVSLERVDAWGVPAVEADAWDVTPVGADRRGVPTGDFLPRLRALPGVDAGLVLTPVDGSEDARRTADYAVAVASRYSADLHLLFVLDQRVAEGVQTGDVDAEAVAAAHQEFLSAVQDQQRHDVEVTTSSAAGFSTARLDQTPGSVVLDAAEELGADFLVVPRETPEDDVDVTIGKAALYILQYADQPVLSV